MIGEIKTLHPVFRLTVDRILLEMRAKGWDAVIGSGMRTMEEQAALYAQGREDLDHVNKLRRDVGLPAISAKANARSVTNARPGRSNHNLTTSRLYRSSTFDVVHGFAVDIVSKAHGWEPINKRFWKDLGEIAKRNGCSWGGDWKKPDPAHVEMKIVDGAPRSSIIV